MALTAVVWGGGCNNPNEIKVLGSTSVQPYAEMLAQEFEQNNPGKRIDVSGGGSSFGIGAAIDGTADIGMSSRELNEKETDAVNSVIAIAKDGLAIIVHPKNPVRDLSVEQIRQMYLREITDWTYFNDDLDADWNKDVKSKTTEIHIVTREAGSGTRSVFEELIMDKRQISSKALVYHSNGTMMNYVSINPNAIGFISMGLVIHDNGERVKAVSIDGVAALPDNVRDGTYNLFREFYFVFKNEPTGLTKDFIDFALSEQGKDILERRGLVVE